MRVEQVDESGWYETAVDPVVVLVGLVRFFGLSGPLLETRVLDVRLLVRYELSPLAQHRAVVEFKLENRQVGRR